MMTLMQAPVPMPPVPPPPGVDPNFVVEQVAPIVGVIAVVIAGALALKWLFRSPVGDALAEWIRMRSRRRRHWRGLGGEWLDAPEDEGAEAGRVAALEQQVAQLSSQLSELAERLDFAERLLAERREHRLGAGRESR